MASLLRQQMRKELRRLDANDRDKAIRKALANKRQIQRDLVANPCPWWSATDTRAHAAWLSASPPAPVRWEQLDPCKKWVAGQPVLLVTGGHEHVAYVRLEYNAFESRWLSGSIPEHRVSPAELTLRDPRQVWSNALEIQVAIALLSADTDPRCAWLRDIDAAADPDLFDLLELAREELARRPAPPTGPAPMPSPEPKPRRGWTRAEIDALRLPADVVEPVDLAPGR